MQVIWFDQKTGERGMVALSVKGAVVSRAVVYRSAPPMVQVS